MKKSQVIETDGFKFTVSNSHVDHNVKIINSIIRSRTSFLEQLDNYYRAYNKTKDIVFNKIKVKAGF